MVDEEDPPLGPVCMRDRGLGEDGKGIRDPVDDDYVVGVLLLDLLGHGEQTGLIQNTPPIDSLCILVTFLQSEFWPLCPREALSCKALRMSSEGSHHVPRVMSG
jgi:hypothetical protein